MRRSMRWLATAAVAASCLLGGATATVVAQGDECSLLTADEVKAALSMTEVQVTGGATYCMFSGDSMFSIASQPGADLAQQKAGYADAVDTTIAGNPAVSSEAGSAVVVGLPGQLLLANYYGSLAWDAALPAVTGLLELAIPRVPPGPDPADVARLQALIPETISGSPTKVQSFGGDLLLGFMDQTAAPVIALNEAFAAQGKSAADVLFVGGETEDTEDEYSVVAVLIKGADAGALLEPLFNAFSSSSDGQATFTPTDVAGRPAVDIKGATDQERLVAMTSGDVILAATVPDAELEAVFAKLP